MSLDIPPADSAPSFANTLREQDEFFYAVFPQARSNGNSSNSHFGDKYILNLTREHELFLIPQARSNGNSSNSHFGDKYILNLTREHELFLNAPSQSIIYHQAWTNDLDANIQYIHRTTNANAAFSDDNVQAHISNSNICEPSLAQSTAYSLPCGTIQQAFPDHRLERFPDEGRRRHLYSLHQSYSVKLPIRSQLCKRTEKKPALACLFCRGRKIACGPPIAGTKEKTCGQCQRRSLTCVYPSESRRGMRKKNVTASLSANSVA